MDFDYKNSFARWYFYITPLFILLDYIYGINVRVSALDTMPTYKNIYYGFCILCGIGMFITPRYAAIVALFESSINFMMIVLGLFMPYVQNVLYAEDILNADFKAVGEAITAEPMANLIIVGACVVLTFRKSIETIADSFGFDNQAIKK
ncbi:MAG: hypothetical protein RQ760_18355 [Sedimentisphaerales bacterium]|nr:hypothetical protein [Sedimentisphaerales bacterium]